jgi:hypothetical protein
MAAGCGTIGEQGNGLRKVDPALVVIGAGVADQQQRVRILRAAGAWPACRQRREAVLSTPERATRSA